MSQFTQGLLGLILTALLIPQVALAQKHPPPFEKIYVGPTDVFTTPEGIFYINDFDIPEKVRALRSDCHGTYVIKFICQCPVCDRCYTGKSPAEGFDCPLWKRENLPHQWSIE